MNTEKNYWGIDIAEEISNPNYKQNINDNGEDLELLFSYWKLDNQSTIDFDLGEMELWYQFIQSRKNNSVPALDGCEATMKIRN